MVSHGQDSLTPMVKSNSSAHLLPTLSMGTLCSKKCGFAHWHPSHKSHPAHYHPDKGVGTGVSSRGTQQISIPYRYKIHYTFLFHSVLHLPFAMDQRVLILGFLRLFIFSQTGVEYMPV